MKFHQGGAACAKLFPTHMARWGLAFNTFNAFMGLQGLSARIPDSKNQESGLLLCHV